MGAGYSDRDLIAQRARQDRFLAAQQRQFDGDVRENTDKRGGWKRMKYQRASFTVVTASDSYREGYDQITWSTPQDVGPGSNRVEVPAKENINEPHLVLRKC